MAKRTDKRTSNLIIAGGYCLVAIIILFNYLGQTARNRVSVQTANKSTNVIQNKDIIDLKKQLEEEKKVNSEMRALLRQIQKTGSLASSLPNGPTFRGSIEELGRAIPNLNLELLKNAMKPRPNPFSPEKNPYAPIRKVEETQKETAADFLPFAQSLKCDPRLPYLFSAANSEAVFLGN